MADVVSILHLPYDFECSDKESLKCNVINIPRTNLSFREQINRSLTGIGFHVDRIPKHWFHIILPPSYTTPFHQVRRHRPPTSTKNPSDTTFARDTYTAAVSSLASTVKDRVRVRIQARRRGHLHFYCRFKTAGELL